MDEGKAWDNFIASGSIKDYLIYREAKACAPQGALDKNTEAENEVQNRRSNTDGANSWGE